MSYIGNQFTSVPHIVDVFSGNGSATSFGPLVRSPAGTAAIAVFINGVYRTPGLDYTLNGNYITFISPPAAGVSNIVIHHLGNGTTTQVPSDQSVTGTKLQDNTVRGNNIVAGQVTSNLMSSNVAITHFSANTTLAVPVFADNAARDSAITSPRHGIVAFVISDTQFQGYTGSSWISLN